ncbi:hypothetical protein ZIOFF_075798 [Zingiber officinale]|uniref:Uncharacterized protein n=1 Tax=Zingiber officinale TaxID=94328 RepID=A0A8J5B8N0_ZINOF|nr:hypothetical protein ZIOFF_075798 [Zingiber officinale]
MKDDYEYRLIYLKSLAIAAAMDIVSPILEISGVNHVINKLVDKTTNYLQDQCYWETYLQEELKSLQDLLPQIEAVVSFAEHRLTSYESSDRALIKWLWKFRDVIDEAEDVLDELEYLELETKANSDKSWLSRRVDASVNAAKRLLKFDDVLGRLRTCVKNLNTSASDVEKFLALVTPTGGVGTGQMQQGILPLSHQSRITFSLPVSSFKGPLGGMGKTALAQEVFDHFKNVKKEHFDIKIWVCDSLPDLNSSNLTKKILEYSTGRSESGPLELIPEKLKEKLHSKRFLLVLDDAWDDKNQREWEKLCAPLLYGQKGSWVLLTTRSKSVANMVAREIKGTMMPMMLQGLSEDECLSLLYEHAFAGQDPNGFPLLKEIGREIVKKLKGVPLLAKSIGGALNSKLEADHWTNILRSELWKRSQDSTYNFIPVLTLSYVMLPPRLKRCFAYCMHEYTLFSVAKVGKLTSLQELCFPISTKPGHRIEELMNMDNLRKLTIKQLSNVRSLEKANMVNLVKKRYLISLELDWNVANNPDDDASNPDLDQPVLAALQPYPTIRELTIRGYKGGRPAPWMDTSLSLLGNLQLNACTSLEELPSLWKLPCLKFLKLNEMNAIRSLGCHFSSQIDIQFPVLEQLGFYDLPLLEEWNGADDYIWFPHLKSFKICDYPKLKKIPDLPLSIKNLTLENLGLEALPRSYNYKCSNGSRTFGGFQRLMMSLETLQISECPKIVQIGLIDEDDDHLLPSSLKELTLSILFKDDDLASYLQGLTLLTGLSLYFSPGVESLPLANELEHLTALQRLYIKSGETLTSPGGLYIIKSLTSLSISDCPKFLSAAEVESEEFLKDKTRKHAVSSSSVFDHSASDKVTSILPSSLEYLSFTDSGISQESLGRCLQGLSSLKDLKVSGCHRLVSLPNIEYLHNLTALQKLRIYDCKELCELESLTGLASLRILEIKRCSKLATTTEQSATKKKKGALPSLEDIDIDDIFYLPMIPISEKLKTLYIISSDKELTCFPSEIEESLLQYRKSLENLHLYRMSHLQSLPASLESFSSLKFLRIHSAPELKSLPRMPASLERLTIYGCSAKLEKRYQKNIGRDCPNIKYIEITADKEDKAEVC